VADDIQEVINAKQVYVIRNPDSQKDVLFYSDARYVMNVDEDIKTLWKNTPLPTPLDVERELTKAGLKLVQQEKPSADSLKKEKKARKKRNIKLTNTHLADIDLSKDYQKPPSTTSGTVTR